MSADEEAIRELVQTWLDATQQGDHATVRSLMDDDVVFMVPGREPFGKEAFNKSPDNVRVQGKSEILEIKILGEWAWLRQHLRVTVHSPNAAPTVLSGCTLTIFHKKPSGKWMLARDANLLTPEAQKPGANRKGE